MTGVFGRTRKAGPAAGIGKVFLVCLVPVNEFAEGLGERFECNNGFYDVRLGKKREMNRTR